MKHSLLALLILAIVMGADSGRAAVSSNLTAAVEGTLEVVIADDFENHRAETFHSVVETKTGKKYKLTFAGLPPADVRTGMRVRVEGKVQGEEFAMATDTALTDVAGGAAFTVLDSPELAALDTRNTLVILMNFTNQNVACSKSSVNSLMFSTTGDSVKGFYEDCSYGAITFSGKVVGPYDVNLSTSSPGSRDQQRAAGDAAARAGGDEPNDYDHLVYVLPPDSGGSAGLAEVGGRHVWLRYCGTMIVYAHELGHNLGMLHASSDFNDDGAVDDEYGDYSCVMGNANLAGPNVMWKRKKGWVPSSKEMIVTATDTFQVAPLTTPPGNTTHLQCLRLNISGSSQDYYLSYRRANGYDGSLSSTEAPRVYVNRWSGSGNTLLVKNLASGGRFDKESTSGFTVKVINTVTDYATIQIAIPGSPGTRVWSDNGARLWNNTNRWSDGDIPEGANENAKFSAKSGSDSTATESINGITHTLHNCGLNGISPTIGQLHLHDNASGADGWRLYCGNGTSTLTVNGDAGDSGSPVILNTYGSHLIDGDGGGTLKLKLGRSGANIIKVANNLQINADIMGADSGSGLTKTGNGALVLAGTNTFSGMLVVNAGSVIGQTNAKCFGGGGTGDIRLGDVSGSADAKLLNLGTLAVANPITVRSGSSGVKTIGNATGGGTMSCSGTVTLNDDVVLQGTASASTQFMGIISGSGAVTTDGNSVRLAALNTYTGLTTIGSGATLLFQAGPSCINYGNDIVVNGTLDLNGFAQTFNSVTGGGSILTGTGDLTIGSGNASPTFSGSISGGGALTKAGGGTLTLSAANIYTGGTTVSQGTLALGASGSFANSASMSIAAGATLDTSAKTSHAIPATQPLAFGIDATDSGSSGKIVAADLDITNATVTYNISGTPDDPVYVLATYTSLTGTAFAAPLPASPSGYTLDYAYEGNKIALVQTGGDTAPSNYLSWATVNSVTGGTNGDSDNDGVPNLVEYSLIDGAERGVLSGYTITFTKRGAPYGTDLTYAIEVSTDPGITDYWHTPGSGVTENASIISYTFTPSSPVKNFARLKVLQAP